MQELAAAVELMDRALELKYEAEKSLLTKPNDPELLEIVEKQTKSYELFSKKAKEIKARIESANP